jgi:hypothetical protein
MMPSIQIYHCIFFQGKPFLKDKSPWHGDFFDQEIEQIWWPALYHAILKATERT